MMGKSTQHKPGQEKVPVKKRISSSSTTRSKGHIPSNLIEDAFSSFSDAIVLCDCEGRILRMNAAALRLFDVGSEQLCQGASYQQFLQRYEIRDERNQRLSLGEWLLNVLLHEERSPCVHEEHCPRMHEQLLFLRAPSGPNVYLNLRCSLVLNTQQQVVGMASVFHEITHQYQTALHLQRVYEATVALTEAITQLPTQMDFTVSAETFLLSPPIAFIAQQLAEVIGHVLDCHQLLLVAFEPPAGFLYYVAGYGFSPEQTQQFRENCGRYFLSDVADETVITSLQAGQAIVLPARRLFFPLCSPGEPSRKNYFLLPLFLEHQWMGVLGIDKRNSEKGYTAEEIELVTIVLAQAALIIECAHGLSEYAEARSRKQMLDEASRLSNDFLTLAAHELRTPLTGIKGNLQLAQRRLQVLKCQLAEQPEQLAHVQHSLVAATQGTKLQERMLQDMLDDASIQSDHLAFVLKPCDLLALVKETVAMWQEARPARAIVLETSSTKQRTPILADAARIKRVLNRYIENALAASSTHQAVTVRLDVENALARVAVHHEGVNIPLEEQGQIWKRSYRAQGSTVQHALDLSLGLGLYLCRVFIERHHGSVGVQSAPGQGETFWFTLPLISSGD